jgi:hypothetical protein
MDLSVIQLVMMVMEVCGWEVEVVVVIVLKCLYLVGV